MSRQAKAQKQERDRMKKAMKKQRKKLRQLCASVVRRQLGGLHLCQPIRNVCHEAQEDPDLDSETVDFVAQALDLNGLQELCQQVQLVRAARKGRLRHRPHTDGRPMRAERVRGRREEGCEGHRA